MDQSRLSAEELRQYEVETRGWMQLFVPAIARYDPNKHLTTTGFSSLMWLANIERYTELNQAGIEMLAIAYPSWKQDARRTALSMLEYCGCRPDDLNAVEETLRKDSQAGSVVSQDVVKERIAGTQLFDPEELNRHLQAHPYIRRPDFEVANTLKF
jgi:hypothetical protein